MKRNFKCVLILLSACIILFGCSGQEQNTNSLNSEVYVPDDTEVWRALHEFNWIPYDENAEEDFSRMPFLEKNNDAVTSSVAICDVDRDGELEILMSSVHIPRGIPAVEVFKIRRGQLFSVGGFYEGRGYPVSLSYYRDGQGRLLLVQNTESAYGGFIRSLVVTEVDTWRTFPVASYYCNYDREPYYYYTFRDSPEIEYTLDMLYTQDYPTVCEVTEEEYRKHMSEFMDSLTWEEDVSFEYVESFHLYNGFSSPAEIRYNEIWEALETSSGKDFSTQEEWKKTSYMIADILYQKYITITRKEP